MEWNVVHEMANKLNAIEGESEIENKIGTFYVNFINILRADFSLKSLHGEFFTRACVCTCIFWSKNIDQKKLNFVEIGKRCRFHQHFKTGKCFELLFSSYRCQFHQRFMCAFFI